jgi:hypothetical protein
MLRAAHGMSVPLVGNDLPLHSSLISEPAPSAESAFAPDSDGLFCSGHTRDTVRLELRIDEDCLKKVDEEILKKLSE